jgi:hypothetical protein
MREVTFTKQSTSRATGLTTSAIVLVSLIAWFQATPTQPTNTRPSPVDDLIARHGCSTGNAPAEMEGRIPGHVVATDDGHTVYSAGLVRRALKDVFERDDPSLQVHAFCR